MNSIFITDEGGSMGIETLITYIKSKANDLLREGYAIEDIIYFYDNAEWIKMASIIMWEYKIRNYNNL